MKRPQHSAERLRSKGLRRTAARVAVLDAVLHRGAPLSHSELKADPRVEDADPVTLYRTLSSLVDAKLLHRVQGPDGAWRYCPQPEERPGCPGNHAHFWCDGCESMECLLEQPIPRIDVPEGAKVIARSLVVLGLCATCAASSQANDGDAE